MLVSIPVITYSVDHGDGGGSVTHYNNLEDLRVDRFSPDHLYCTPEEAETKFQACVNGDDPHELGEIGNETLLIEVDSAGVGKLTSPLRVHWGQCHEIHPRTPRILPSMGDLRRRCTLRVLFV